MGKMLVIADMKDSCVATPRGLQLAHKLGCAVEVVAFTYVPLKRLQLGAAQEKKMKAQLLKAREQTVQSRIDKFKQPGQKISLKVVWEKDIENWVVKRSAKSCDMVVKTGSRGKSLIFASIDW